MTEYEAEIRHLRSDDVDRVLRFFAALGPESRTTFAPHAFDAENAARICRTSDGIDNVRLVAVEDGEIVGYCYFESRDLPYPTVGLGIADHAQNRGLGHRLMTALIAEARRLGKPGLDLTVWKTNPRAQRVYTAAGFRFTGETPNRVEFTMHLDLSEPADA
ncbi:MAG: GNAT family N-acetyltransferase [Armatimonadetes bacterium]|nr:GNAT family N-acetyltransferase [Armatimonadota bacterium]